MARAPATFAERITANCRPQPAIPALLVLVLTLMLAMSFGARGVAWATWATVAGLLASCGLAVAAGFCSLFPPLAWVVVAWLAANVLQRLPDPAWPRLALVAGTVAAIAMVALQVWRVRTGRFAPTVEDDAERQRTGSGAPPS